MPQVSKGFTFTNGTTADATQVNADLDTLFNLVNGGMDTANFLPQGIGTGAIADGAVTPAKTEGLPYSSDLFGSSFVVSGLTVTKYAANEISVSAGTAYMKQADATVRQESITTTTLTTTSPSATYYLDLNPDGTWSFTTGHSSTSGYLNIATVTTDNSGNVGVITQNNAAYKVTLLGSAVGPVSVQGLVADPFNTISYWL